MFVNTETLAETPISARRWWRLVRGDGADGAGDEAALTAMAEASGTDLAGYQAQLASTAMFYDPPMPSPLPRIRR